MICSRLKKFLRYLTIYRTGAVGKYKYLPLSAKGVDCFFSPRSELDEEVEVDMKGQRGHKEKGFLHTK